MRTRLISLAVFLAMVMLAPASQGGSAELMSPVSDELKQLAQTRGKVRVIVHLNTPFVPEPELEDQNLVAAQRQTIAATQAFVRSRLTGVQHRVARQPSGLPFLAVELDADGLRALEAQRGVVKLVEEDKLERPGLFQSVPQVGGADAFMRHGVTGSGQAVAILDTGVDKNHNFFGGRVVREACFSTNLPPFPITSVCPGGLETVIGNNAGLNCPPFVAGCDHGTHVAGIAAGGSPGVSGSGVAPGAKIIAIQVFSRIDDAGFCAPDPSPCVAAFSSDIIEALNHVFSIRNQLAPDVIAAVNMSLGGTATAASCPLDSRKPAIDQLRAAGIATFIASGNEFKTGAISPPACIPTAISVGAVTKQDVVADYSNSASTLGLLAPGGAGAQFGVPEDDILSSVPGNQFDFKAGTSMASPHAAGAFALMREAHPTASIDVLVGAMKAAGVPVIDTRPGASGRVKPRIDVRAAIDAAKGDLVTTVLTGPTNIAAGATYALKFSVKNTGPTPVAPSLLGLFISPDNTITLADVALGSTPVPALNPGVTFSGSVAVTVPSNTTLGPTFFGAIANVDGAADEATQANNSRASAAAVVVLPDYSVLSVLSSLLAAAPGSNVTVTHTVKNVAAAPNTGPASVSELFVSTDNALDGTDVSLGTVPVPALIAGGASAPKRIVQAPTQVGLYWIFARANTGNTIIEASTANNVRATSKPLIVGPDLLPTAAPLTPTAKVPGSVFGVATSVKNQGGAAAAGPFNVTVYLSTDATFDGGDVAIGTRVVNTLAPGATSLGTVMVTILPSQAQGAYFLLVRADAGGVVPEADETNNVKASAKAFIVGTDLLPTAAPLAPTAKAPGGPAFSVSTTVKNQGGAAAGPFDVNVYLSTDATFDGADTLVGTRRVAGGLAPGATSIAPVSVTIVGGQALDSYFLIVRADAGGGVPAGEVPESDETNNEKASAKAFIVGPDLLPTVAPLAPTAKAPGGPAFSVSTTVKNQGGAAAGPFDVNVYLSTDATFDGADTLVGTRRVAGGLAAGATSIAPVSVTIVGGQALDSYFLIVRADATGGVNGEVAESDETNNEKASAKAFIVGPDLLPTVAPLAPAAKMPGGPAFSVSTTVKNQGGAAAGPFDVNVYLSTDATFDGADTLVGTRRVAGGLAPGATSLAPVSVTIVGGQPLGSYFLIVRADAGGGVPAGEVPESDETNNEKASAKAFIVGPDLTVTAATRTPAIRTPGTNVTVGTSVKNQGGQHTGAGGFDVKVYLSTNATFDAGVDVEIGTRRIATGLAPGVTSTVTIVATIQGNQPPGAYFILVRADAGGGVNGEVNEADETNNVRSAGALTVTP